MIWPSHEVYPMALFSRRRNMARRKNRGATAVEFALIATPFVFMIFALIETMLVFFTQTTLEAAVAEESRKIRTGQAQSTAAPISQTQFKANVCNRLYGLADCTNRLFVLVEAFSAVPTGPLAQPWTDGSLVPGSAADEPYQASTSGQMVIVRSFYVWPLLTPGLSNALSNYSGGAYGSYNRMLVATSAFRNEPYE